MPSETVYVFSAQDDGSLPIVGALTRTQDGGRPTGVFGYTRSWLENRSGVSYPLDPERMPLARMEFTTQKRSGLPGPIADALPDRWGRRVIEAQHVGPILSDINLLLLTGEGGVGRLRFSKTPSPPRLAGAPLATHQLDAVADAFARIEKDEPVVAEMEALYAAGRSLGGARPKTAVQHEGASWIAKLQRKDDEFDQCAAEHATMRLAALCGLDVAETRVVDTGSRRALLVRRFDRNGLRPSAHYVSALSALDLDDTSHDGGYPQLAGYLRRHSSAPNEDMRELFRRMAFNILSGNRDDHLKNHALLHRNGMWRLSPAFDVVPQLGHEPGQAISVGVFGPMATLDNAVSRAADFGMSREEAQAEIDRILVVASRWRERFAEWGAPDDTIRRLERCFALASAAR